MATISFSYMHWACDLCKHVKKKEKKPLFESWDDVLAHEMVYSGGGGGGIRKSRRDDCSFINLLESHSLIITKCLER